MDRVERLAFNALPAALTADMWTHVYVQQANSVFAGVTHNSSRASRKARPCPRASCASDEAASASGAPSAPMSSAPMSPAPPPPVGGGGPPAFSEIQDTNYFGTSHFPCCITNFPQGWPKYAQSAVLTDAAGALVVASMVPLVATVPLPPTPQPTGARRPPGARPPPGGVLPPSPSATLRVDTAYPFSDVARLLLSAPSPTTLKVRIPAWAVNATVQVGGGPLAAAANGTFVSVECGAGNTTVVVDLKPQVRVERGWGDTLGTPPSSAVAITRGALVFAHHPRERRRVVRTFATTPSFVGVTAPDYEIATDDTWNYALDLAAGATFVGEPSGNWSLGFAFDDSGEYPFAVDVIGRQVPTWGYWRGSNITNPPPTSPVDVAACGDPTRLRLVPFGSTNIRVAVWPYVSDA